MDRPPAADFAAHLDRLAALLDTEREEERRRFDEESARLRLEDRAARGHLLLDLEVVDESVLMGRPLLSFARRDGSPLEAARFSVGAMVRLRPRRDPSGEEGPSGVIARRSRAGLAVAFDGLDEDGAPDWALSGRVLLELLPSAATYERLQAGIARMRSGPDALRWRGPLWEGAPRFRQRPRDLPTEEASPERPAADPAAALNPEQRAALELAERAEDLSLVHGPPGTGKTTVLLAIIRRAVRRGESVLCCAPSNLAVDNLVERLAQAGVRAVRMGHPARVLEEVLSCTLEARVRAHDAARLAQTLIDQALRLQKQARKAPSRRSPERFAEARADRAEARSLFAEARRHQAVAEADVMDRAEVVLATLTGLAHPAIVRRRFDLVVIDEATQAVEPAAYLALCRGARAVLAGDHLQLGPTVLSAAAQHGGLGLSLFERLIARHGADIAVTLRTQHRMNEQIMGYPCQALYDGQLRAHPAVATHVLDADEAPLVLLDTAGSDHSEEVPRGGASRDNPGEARRCAAEVTRLIDKGIAPRTIAVIAPYDAQVQRLRQLLQGPLEAGLEVDTVDGFQGREKEVVVLSLVRSNPEGEVGFLSEVRRMNVAITRARRRLYVILDGATVARHPFYEGFLRYAEALSAWRSVWEEPPE